MGMGRDQFLGHFWQLSPFPLLRECGYSEHISLFLTNVGVLGGLYLVSRIHKQKKLQSISYLSAPEIPKIEKKIIGTFSKTALK